MFVAPHPVLARFQRLYNRMLRSVKMLGGMFVLRGIAATHVAAFKAKSQMDPGVAHFQTLFAALGVRGDLLDFV